MTLIQTVFGEERADSLDYRLENEDLLIAKALQRPILGWAGWGRNRVYDETGKDMTITDGYWIILFGTCGYTGLFSMTLAMALPAALFIKRFPVGQWNRPELAAVTVFGVILNLFLLDCLVNAFPNLFYVMLAGGLFNIIPTGKLAQISEQGTASKTQMARSWNTQAAHFRAQGRTLKDQGQLIEAKIAWMRALDLMARLTEAQPGNLAFRRQWCDCANDLAWLLANTNDLALRDPDRALRLAL